MKYLAVFLLVCLGFASALPLDSTDLELSELDEYTLNAEGDHMVLQGRMKDMFESLLERISNSFQEDTGVSKHLFKKAQDIYDKLKNRGSLSERLKQIFEDLRSKMGSNSPTDIEMDDFPLYDDGSHMVLQGRLRDRFESLLERMRNSFQEGKGIPGNLFKKAQDIYDKLKNRGSLSEKLKQIFEDLRSKMGRNSPAHIEMDDFPLYAEGDRLDKLVTRMKELFEKVVNRMKSILEEGREVRKDLFKAAENLYRKLKDLGVEVSESIKNTFEEIRSKLGRDESVSNADISNIFDLFKRLKNLIKEKLDSEELKAKVEKLFGKGSELAEQIINMLREKGEKGKNKILDWIDRVIPDKEERSASDIGEQIRDFFKDLNIDLKNRFTKFGVWVEQQYKKGFEKGKSKAQHLKKIAQEFLDNSADLGKDFVSDALDFFREYKDDLGQLFDVVAEKARKVLEH